VDVDQQEAMVQAPRVTFGEQDVMKKTKTTEITIETNELIVIKGLNRSTYGRCETCGTLVQMVTLAEAARIARVSELTSDQITARFLHATETNDRQVLICLNSLLT
jgi:hypothetical protein